MGVRCFAQVFIVFGLVRCFVDSFFFVLIPLFSFLSFCAQQFVFLCVVVVLSVVLCMFHVMLVGFITRCFVFVCFTFPVLNACVCFNVFWYVGYVLGSFAQSCL